MKMYRASRLLAATNRFTFATDVADENLIVNASGR